MGTNDSFGKIRSGREEASLGCKAINQYKKTNRSFDGANGTSGGKSSVLKEGRMTDALIRILTEVLNKGESRYIPSVLRDLKKYLEVMDQIIEDLKQKYLQVLFER